MIKKKRMIVLLGVFAAAMLILAGCSMTKRADLSEYLNSTLEYCISNTQETVTYDEEDGTYANEDSSIMIELKDNVIWKIAILADNSKYSIYGVGVGDAIKSAQSQIEETFTSDPEVTADEETGLETYIYQSGNIMVTVAVDEESKVSGISAELTGYSVGNLTSDTSSSSGVGIGDVIAKVGDIEVTYSEAMVYLLTAQQQYESEFGNDVWSYDIEGNGTTIGQVLKSKVLDQIVQLEIICCQANKLGISLNDDEMLQVKDDAATYMESISENEQEEYGITEELAVQVFAANALAEKVYETTTIDVDTNVSDEEAKQITVDIIHLKNYGEDSEGNRTELTESELDEVSEKMSEIYKTAKKTDDFKSLAEKNSEDDTVEYTVGYGDLDSTLEEVAFSLETGKLSKIIETDDGYYLIYCEDDYDDDATLQKKEEVIEQRRSDLFVELYTEWSGDYEVKVNSSLWSQVDLSPLEEE